MCVPRGAGEMTTLVRRQELSSHIHYTLTLCLATSEPPHTASVITSPSPSPCPGPRTGAPSLDPHQLGFIYFTRVLRATWLVSCREMRSGVEGGPFCTVSPKLVLLLLDTLQRSPRLALFLPDTLPPSPRLYSLCSTLRHYHSPQDFFTSAK